MPERDDSPGNDLLRGGSQIAGFVLGDPTLRRSIYRLAATSNIPTFKLGSMVCARRSVLRQWIEDQERKRRAHKHNKPDDGSDGSDPLQDPTDGKH